LWNSFGYLAWDPRRRSGFLSGDEKNYGTPLTAVKEEEQGDEEEVADGDQVPREEERDSNNDYVDYLAFLVEKAKKEGTTDQLPFPTCTGFWSVCN
jgi:hypothetical protein